MRRVRTLLAAAATAAAVVLGGASSSSGMAVPPAPAGATAVPESAVVIPSCGTEDRPGYARCLSRFRSPGTGFTGTRVAAPRGFGPGQFRAAYGLPATGARTTIGVVVAFDVPKAAADLAVYRRTMGLPPCTTATGCFRKVNQRGTTTPLPAPDPGWALEGSMDIQLASATCPTCKILLVVADDNYDLSLAAATRTAIRLGATVLSHSYGTYEYGGMWGYRDTYERAGTVSVAASGDFGFDRAQAPAVFSKVLAVGGTSLRRAGGTSRGWDENVWSGAGSACSAYVPKPAYQRDSLCKMRTVADVSAVADPETGVAVYDTYPNQQGLPPGWLIGGGTSASAPLVAGMVALAGSGAAYNPAKAYAARAAFWDVVGGRNGQCAGDYVCTGVPGYDAPSGLGTPRGLAGLGGR